MTTVSRIRKTALMGAAATAFMGAARSLYAGVSVEQTPTVQSAVKEILSGGPKPAAAPFTIFSIKQTPVRINAIDIGNDDDISVGANESAISQAETVEDIDVVNTGNLTGGIGIDVATGVYDLDDFDPDSSYSYSYATTGDMELLFDDAGNPVSPYGYQMSVATADLNIEFSRNVLNHQSLESAISIDNSGSIAFTGTQGIKAVNPIGESIDITNSGDITTTSEIEGRAGIYASTEAAGITYTDTLNQPGIFTRNADGQLTGVIERNDITVDILDVDMGYDAGVINIHNTGDIDMGAADALIPVNSFISAGIYTKGDGGTTIVNEGNIRVGDWSSGIRALSTATTSITNAGRIEIGNASSGIAFAPSRGSAGDYRLGGDVYILNTGDIVGGIAKSEAAPGELLGVQGIYANSLGSNNEYYAGLAHLNELHAAYNEALGYEAFTIYDVPNTRLYDTTVVNQGHIELQDGGRGVYMMPLFGESTVINSGTIVVGDGTSRLEDNAQVVSAGIWQNNFPVSGLATTVSINSETGIIVTGDDGAGMQTQNFAGTSIIINDGSITTGDGIVGLVTLNDGTTFDRVMHSRGIMSISRGPMIGTTAYALNSGVITVGDLAIGSMAVGNGIPLVDPTRPTAININEGIIATGDNSSGMFTTGTNASTLNTGRITTGNYDISAYQPHAEYTADEFAQLRYGATSVGGGLAVVINHGTITTGNGTVGAAAHLVRSGYGYGSQVTQNEEGVITTGDDSIGARVSGSQIAVLDNSGRITVGDDSIGVDMTVGAVVLRQNQMTATIVEGAQQAINVGIIETGDSSIGVNLNAVLEDVSYSGGMWVADPDAPYGYSYHVIEGTADAISASYLANNGVIRVGADSTGVVITGTAASEQGLHFFNTGTVDASVGSSTALRLNAEHNIDSYAVNVGTMAGDIIFGAGDDRFINTLMLDNAGRVTHSGNIVMNGSTIDFGTGTNHFDNDQGTITVLGGENLITGADVVMTQGIIEARNNAVDSSLTIDGNVSGSFQFGADFNANGDADQLVITGDVAEGSGMRVILNPTGQMSGESTFKVITIGGENAADDPVLAGITGAFADSVISAEVNYEDGEVNVTATFGMGHMATSATAATSMAQQWWMQSIGSLNKRDMQRLAEQEDDGLSTWASVFHEEGSVDPTNDLQDVSFDQKVSGLQAGVEWKGDIGGGSFNVGPMFSYGNASANQNANLASAMGDATAYGLNAGYRFSNGLYFNASWQQMAMEIDFRTPGTFSNATGNTDAEGDGFDLELGYAYRLSSGLTLAPQLQFASVDVEVDDFATSDGVYELSGMGGKHSLLRAGVSVFKTFQTTNGSITPLLDLSYLDAMDGDSDLSSNGIAFGNDTTGSGYRAELGVAGRYKSWDIAGRVGFADTTTLKSALSSNLTVRCRW